MDFYTSNMMTVIEQWTSYLYYFYVAGNVLWNIVSFGTNFSWFFLRDPSLTLIAQKYIDSKSYWMAPNG